MQLTKVAGFLKNHCAGNQHEWVVNIDIRLRSKWTGLFDTNSNDKKIMFTKSQIKLCCNISSSV